MDMEMDEIEVETDSKFRFLDNSVMGTKVEVIGQWIRIPVAAGSGLDGVRQGVAVGPLRRRLAACAWCSLAVDESNWPVDCGGACASSAGIGRGITGHVAAAERDGSPVGEPQTRVDQLAEQLAAIKRESRRHAQMSQGYKCEIGELWSVDVMGPFPVTTSGNQYIVIMTKRRSRWIEVAAVPNRRATTISAVVMHHIVANHWVPKIILTGQGTCFESEAFKKCLQMLGICVVAGNTVVSGGDRRGKEKSPTELDRCSGNNWQETASRKAPPFPVGAKIKWKDHQDPGRSGLGSRELRSRRQAVQLVFSNKYIRIDGLLPFKVNTVSTVTGRRRSKICRKADLNKFRRSVYGIVTSPSFVKTGNEPTISKLYGKRTPSVSAGVPPDKGTEFVAGSKSDAFYYSQYMLLRVRAKVISSPNNRDEVGSTYSSSASVSTGVSQASVPFVFYANASADSLSSPCPLFADGLNSLGSSVIALQMGVDTAKNKVDRLASFYDGQKIYTDII
ncbi:hypothetical protein CLF_108351 [Clonorchis sinensis]|uniref:Integrase catalytic domain-containing protein n=1 Tax=Clonorchis sinensis TaxID=79923 RepID=G7YRJ4_CLOSI|nr:hypothetical protein CLF_108351 [Clonorchis sinensis]